MYLFFGTEIEKKYRMALFIKTIECLFRNSFTDHTNTEFCYSWVLTEHE